MKRENLPTWQELEAHKKAIPEIHPAAVIAMLEIKQAAEEIQASILSVLQQDYHLSEGKFCTLIVLPQHPEGIAPSVLAEKVGVARATISTMLQRLERSGEVRVEARSEDGRGKLACLTAQGRAFLQEVLPPHYLRVSRLMEKLTQQEQEELIRLLRKLDGE